MRMKIFVVAAVFTSSQLSAQVLSTDDDTASKIMDEVVITANKFPQKQSGTGKVVSVITREQILQSAGKDLSQLLNEQTGIVVSGANSNLGKDKSLFLRGATDKYTLFLLDGIPLNDPSGVGGSFDLRLLSLENVERIEILKGSQSTLYGSNAVAGVINIISKKPTQQRPQLKGLATYGSYNTFKGNANLSQKSKVIEYDLNYVYQRTDGISEARDTTDKANFDKDGFTEQAIQTVVGINVTNNLKVSPFYRFTEFKGEYDAAAFTDGQNHYSGSLVNSGLTGHYTYTGGTVHFGYGYDFTKRDYVSQYGEFVTKGKFQHAEAYTDYRFNKTIQLVGGLNFQSYRIDVPDTVNTIVSPYASLFLKTDKGLNLELGGRFNHHSQYGNNFTYSFNPSYLIQKKVKLFVNVTSGFRAPSVNELFGPFFGSNPNLKPEKSNNQEAGLQAMLAQRKLEFIITGFNRSIENVIIYGLNGYENRDKQHDYGAELEITYSVKKVNIKASYAYVDGQVTEKLPGKDTTHYNLIRRPKHNVHLFASYRINQNFFISSSLQLAGKRLDNNYSSFIPAQVHLKSYALLNLYAEYNFLNKRLSVFLDAKNLTDQKDYYEVYGYSVQGFNLNGGIRFHF